MTPIRLALVFALAAAAALGIAATRPAPRADAGLHSTPPRRLELRPIAFVDDHGSLVVRAAPAGFRVEARARHVNHGWRGTIGRGGEILGCAPCPSALVKDAAGRVLHLDGRRVSAVPLPEVRPDRSGGIPGAGPPANRLVWTGRASPTRVVLYALDGPRSRPFVLPLARAEVMRSVVAIDGAARRAVAIAPDRDPLRVASRRLIETTTNGRSRVRHLPVALERADDDGRSSVCISPDGARFAAVLPDAGATKLVEGAFLGRTRADSLAIAAAGPHGCAVNGDGLVVYGLGRSGSGFRVEWRSDSGRRVLRAVDGFVPEFATACRRGDAVVAAGSTGAVVVRRGRATRYARATSAGCTSAGVPWILIERRVRWLA